MKVIHVPFYPSDWLAGTRGLSDSETGIYITLIARMYEAQGPIERDDNRLYRLCGCRSKVAFSKALDHLIAEGKITADGTTLYNERVKNVTLKVKEKCSKSVQAAQARWSKKTNEINEGGDADAMQTHMPTKTKVKKEKGLDKSNPKKKGTRLHENWVLPRDWGEWAISEGYSEKQIRFEAKQFRDYWISLTGQKATKLDWQATWRNWMRRNGKKIIDGGRNDKPEDQLNAFIAGARNAS